ncbi:hypothetical protein J3R75_000498 [Oligosphaera ethanolica]|uniref:Uncharacterized protein n=1 Tax=Oligosphaera ethanolica TaxID=760260 RepID=A0AAE3VDH9_9BACT|nr:hypothetical protein [Oligosphaera ethanolica]
MPKAPGGLSFFADASERSAVFFAERSGLLSFMRSSLVFCLFCGAVWSSVFFADKSDGSDGSDRSDDVISPISPISPIDCLFRGQIRRIGPIRRRDQSDQSDQSDRLSFWACGECRPLMAARMCCECGALRALGLLGFFCPGLRRPPGASPRVMHGAAPGPNLGSFFADGSDGSDGSDRSDDVISLISPISPIDCLFGLVVTAWR